MVGAEEQGFPADAGGIGVPDLTRLFLTGFREQAERRIGPRHALIDLLPFIVQDVLYVLTLPVVEFDAVEWRVGKKIAACVGIPARDTCESPVARRASKIAGVAAGAIQCPVRGDERALDADSIRHRIVIEDSLGGDIEKTLAGERDCCRQHEDPRRGDQASPTAMRRFHCCIYSEVCSHRAIEDTAHDARRKMEQNRMAWVRYWYLSAWCARLLW